MKRKVELIKLVKEGKLSYGKYVFLCDLGLSLEEIESCIEKARRDQLEDYSDWWDLYQETIEYYKKIRRWKMRGLC